MTENDNTKEKLVETYAEDMARVIENDRSGMIKKIIHEEEQHEIVKKNLSPQSKRNRLFMVVGFLMIIVAFVTLYYLFFIKEIPTVPIEEQFTPLIFNDKSSFIEIKDLKKDGIAQIVSNAVNATEVKMGGVEGFYLTYNKKPVGLRQFLSLIQSSFDPGQNTVFVHDNFLLGVVNSDTKPASPDASQGGDFFILIKVRSIEDIFQSLRSWENKMFLDLHGFFGIDISSTTKDLLTKDFEDTIVQNKNARVLKDADGKTIMMYVLADDNSVIIANTENAVREVMRRLASSQIEK